MGQLFVEGLGIILLEGDTPNEEETRVILKAHRDLEETNAPPIPEPIKPPLGIGEIPLEELAEEGPLGLVPRDVRGAVGRAVSDLPGALGFAAEMTPSVAGTIGGAKLGLLATGGNPLGLLGGGIIGGIVGELGGQETGVAPTSEANLALAGAGPLVGRAIGGAARLSGRAGGKIVGALPPARVALARSTIGEATEKLESLGAQILAKGKGILSQPAKDIYNAARQAGVRIQGKKLINTHRALEELRKELLPNKAFPEVAQAIAVIRRVQRTLTGDIDPDLFIRALEKGETTLEKFVSAHKAPKFIDFQTFIEARKSVGLAVRRAKTVSGIRLGGAKKTFAAMSRDLDALAERQSTSRGARLAKAASTRAKTEFAVRDVEALIVRFTEDLGEGELKINAKGLLKAMRALVDPKSKKFDKNFVDGLGNSLPGVMRNLSRLAGFARAGSPGGPGSIVIRGITAGGGAAVGSVVAGNPGAIVGGLLGAGGPEMLTALLMSKPALAFLNAAAKAGRGEVSRRAWMIVGQILTRSLGERQETPFAPSRVPPSPAGLRSPLEGVQTLP